MSEYRERCKNVRVDNTNQMDISSLTPDAQLIAKSIAEKERTSIESVIGRALHIYNHTLQRHEEPKDQFPKALPKHKRIDMDEWGCCTSMECPYKKDCSQHFTAGDFRSEDGFAPMLVRLGPGDRMFACCTRLSKNYNTGNGFIKKSILTETTIGCIPRPVYES